MLPGKCCCGFNTKKLLCAIGLNRMGLSNMMRPIIFRENTPFSINGIFPISRGQFIPRNGRFSPCKKGVSIFFYYFIMRLGRLAGLFGHNIVTWFLGKKHPPEILSVNATKQEWISGKGKWAIKKGGGGFSCSLPSWPVYEKSFRREMLFAASFGLLRLLAILKRNVLRAFLP